MANIIGSVVVHFDERGDLTYRVYGDDRIRLFIVDERAPHDRVYEILERQAPEKLRDMIAAGETIGSSQDERHEAIAARVLAIQDNRPHLQAVDGLSHQSKEGRDG